jgi:hypothetical protein
MTVLVALMPLALAVSAGARAAELVMFESPGCPWCARWRAEVGIGYTKSEEGHKAPLRVHALAEANSAGITLAAPIVVSPTFVLADNGREIGRIVGYPGADFFWGLLGQLMPKLPAEKSAPVPSIKPM